MSLKRFGALALALATFLACGRSARADDIGPSDGPRVSNRCAVEQKCSSTGVSCEAGDLTCQNAATAKGLEIVCEGRPPRRALVYCPAGTGGRDSRVVWWLLAAAGGMAVAGSLISWLVFRKASR